MICQIKNIFINSLPGFLGGIGITCFAFWLERKSKIITYLGSTAVFKPKTKDTNFEIILRTHVLVVRNEGRKPAKNVTINHTYLDAEVCVMPPFDYKIIDIAQGGKAIILPNLPPKQEVIITYLYDDRNPVVHGPILHEEGKAKIITTITVPEMSKTKSYLLGLLLITGGLTWIIFLYSSLSRLV